MDVLPSDASRHHRSGVTKSCSSPLCPARLDNSRDELRAKPPEGDAHLRVVVCKFRYRRPTCRAGSWSTRQRTTQMRKGSRRCHFLEGVKILCRVGLRSRSLPRQAPLPIVTGGCGVAGAGSVVRFPEVDWVEQSADEGAPDLSPTAESWPDITRISPGRMGSIFSQRRLRTTDTLLTQLVGQ